MGIKAKVILFDMDNTLLDFEKMKRKSCEAAIDAMIGSGLKISREEALKILYSLYDKYGIEYQKIFQKFTQHLTGKIDYKIISYGVIAYRKMRESQLVPYTNAVSTLIQLKNHYKLAIISDAPVMEAWMRLVATRLDTFFDIVITKKDTRRQKTSAAPFKAALKALGVKAEEAIMVGDRISRDVQTAKKLGIITCYARYGDTNPPENGKSGADFELSDIKDILEIVRY